MSTGLMATTSMRAEVADSWHLSAAAGVAADRVEAPITLAEDALRDHPRGPPAGPGLPAARRRPRPGGARLRRDHGGLRRRPASCSGSAATPATLRKGREDRLRRGQQLGRTAGRHQRSRAGAAPGPDRSSVRRAEHFRHSVQQWSCAATPIHDPHVDQPARRPRHHRRRRDRRPADHGDGPRRGPDGRGRAGPRAAHAALPYVETAPDRAPRHRVARSHTTRCSRIDDGRGHRHELRLSPRHSEILLLLASAPRGLSGDELAVLLYEDDGASSTLRAELNRLRSLLGDDAARLAALPAGRPGSPPTGSPWRRSWRPATCAAAMRGYRGPILPRSTAPGVVRLREQPRGLACAQPVLPQRPGRPDVDLDPVGLGRRRLRACGRPSERRSVPRRRCWR